MTDESNASDLSRRDLVKLLPPAALGALYRSELGQAAPDWVQTS